MADRETWARRVKEWKASGVSSPAYCAGKDFTAGGLRLSEQAAIEYFGGPNSILTNKRFEVAVTKISILQARVGVTVQSLIEDLKQRGF